MLLFYSEVDRKSKHATDVTVVMSGQIIDANLSVGYSVIKHDVR